CLFFQAASKTHFYFNNIVVAPSIGGIVPITVQLQVSLVFENFPDLENNTLKWRIVRERTFHPIL
ncbi:MAG: hypothetical protein LUO81_04340, partial [Methanoregulaceae archaeon]|nr:hypothetical protein [Methanoregulaceae archaeon]